MLTLNIDKHRPYTILLLGAHSDDIEIGCGGTILKLLAEHDNIHVHWVVFSGSQSRINEAQNSAELFLKGAAAKHVVIKDFQDGFFPFVGAEIKAVFEQLKREVAPDLIFTHYRDDAHQDHRLISSLTWNTFRRHTILEYEIPKYDSDLGSPNMFVQLDDALCRSKTDYLIESFVTQTEKHWFSEDTFMSLLRLRGIQASGPTTYAEAFYCRKLML